jgi:hypothetical protein
MDWFSQLERRRGATIFLIIILTLAVLAVSASREPVALDSYWHLKMGQDWLEKGLSPFRDHYSITHYGERIVDPPFIFQVVIYGFVSLFGLIPGFKAFIFFSSLLTSGMFILWLQRIRAPLPVLAICIFMLLAFLQLRVMVRPELLSYSFMILALILYERTRKEPSPKNFLYIVIFMLFWRNYHSAVLGFVIFSGLFLDIAVQQIASRASIRTWLMWGFWGLLVLSAGFLGHSLNHPVLQMIMFPQEWFELIDEYRPALLGTVNWPTLMLIPLAIFTALSLLHQRLFGYLFVCVIMSAYALTMHRMTAPGGVVIVCLFALVLTRYNLKAILTSGESTRGKAVSGALLLVFLTALATNILTSRDLIARNRDMPGYFPDQMVEYMNEHNLHGRIFNDLNVGGYLIYHLGDNSRVFIDGRVGPLYPPEHMKRWRAALTSPDKLRSEIEKLDVDYLIMGNRRLFVDVVRNAGLMYLDYSDLRYSLYARENANLPISGSLWSMPWCWSGYAGEALMTEKDKALELLPEYSPVAHFITLASEFHLQENPVGYLESIREEDYSNWYEDNLRFAGYRALELGLNELAVEWFFTVREKQFMDFMAGAMANILAGRLDEAESILAHSSEIHWTLSSQNEVEILFRLLTHLQSEKGLELIDQTYLDQVRKLAGHEGEEVMPQQLTFRIFCQ